MWTEKKCDPPVANPPLRKIASIGVHARDWVTWHGFALNVTTDLSYFDLMVPCGIPDVEMTSVARELGTTPDANVVRDAVINALANRFGLTPVSSLVGAGHDPPMIHRSAPSSSRRATHDVGH